MVQPAAIRRDAQQTIRYDVSLFSDEDVYLFNEGSHFRLYEKFGAHIMRHDDQEGVYFSVWAPNAEAVAVMGSFNNWNKDSHPLRPLKNSGIWHCFIPGVPRGASYKLYISSRFGNYKVDKADPFAFYSEMSPSTGSIVWDLNYEWQDGQWMQQRAEKNGARAPISIYEIHLGSWMRIPEEGNRSLTYREAALKLSDYLQRTGFTHVEFLPLMEHPFYGSWGYQVGSFFAPTSRYGTPQDLMFLIDTLHQRGIGVIMDWVPSHFPSDEHGLGYFDGTYLFEHSDLRQRIHPEWESLIFNYGRDEVRAFLISNALFWLDKYHIDGLRVDAVASMLYLDYGRKEGEWIPNRYGGKENIEAIGFLRRLNEEVYRSFPDAQTIAEESTSWPMVSRPTYLGGLGFGMKWDMGWMHDTLDYMSKDPVHRSYHQNQLTFRMMYAFSENFVLSLSHDEVVHGKGALIRKMPGDEWQKFANLRLLFGYMYVEPGKKLLFMGGEFGQWNEWYHESSLDWHLLDYPSHHGLLRWMEDLNRVYRSEPALYEQDFEPGGFQWIDCNDAHNSTLSLVRRNRGGSREIIVAMNFTPVPLHNYRIGAPRSGFWKEILNSDAKTYWGSGQGNMGGVKTAPISLHGMPASLTITVPPLGIVLFQREEVT